MKGAFVLRGADREPAPGADRRGARARVSGAGRVPIGLDPVTLDVAPNLDLFVPFEFAITELAAGWYGLECDVAIDGDPENVRPPKRFAVPWPRATVRRGNLSVNKTARVENGPKVHVEQVECGGESIRVSYTTTPPEAVAGAAERRRIVAHDLGDRVRRRERAGPRHRVPGDADAVAAEDRRAWPPGTDRAGSTLGAAIACAAGVGGAR